MSDSDDDELKYKFYKAQYDSFSKKAPDWGSPVASPKMFDELPLPQKEYPQVTMMQILQAKLKEEYPVLEEAM